LSKICYTEANGNIINSNFTVFDFDFGASLHERATGDFAEAGVGGHLDFDGRAGVGRGANGADRRLFAGA
jgi:hypothetical protein